MKTENTGIRIKDIAKMSGVSAGTVDRVLHERGEVSKKSKEKVEKVLKEINYSPNLLARSLASKKAYRFVCLTPAYQSKEYWESIDRGFDMAAADYFQYHIHLEKLYFDQYDVESFKSATNNILQTKPNAVIMAPFFTEETLDFTHQLTLLNIPFSFIDSMIEGVDFLTYYGQNSFQSGYLAAKLLVNLLPEKTKIAIISAKIIGSESNQTKARKAGFLNFIRENNFPENNLIQVEIASRDENTNLEVMRNIFKTNENLRAIVAVDSKVYRIARYLEKLEINGINLIGYDLLDENVKYLKNGFVSCLFAQRPEKQAYFSVRDICSKLILKQDVNTINFVPIDVILKENIDDYLLFRE